MRGSLSEKLQLNRTFGFWGRRFQGSLLILLLAFPAISVFAQPAGYYDSAEGKSGESLQQALHEIIDQHTVLSYSALWTAFYTTDDRPDGTVWDMYSDNPSGENPYDYNFGSNQCGNYSGEGSCYNREHSFPKSWFNDASPMYTDLFHLYPTDGWVNNKRGNYPFGETDSPTWTSLNGSEVGPCSANGYTGTIFEPIDTYKGDFARTYFYMSVRYYGEDSSWPGSPMVDGAQLKPWAKEMMVRWHEDDPVSEKEEERNDAVYALQGNRNPFIDHPEYVALMYGGENFDEIPPDIDSIRALSGTSLQVWFNEPLDVESALEPSNYTISGGVQIQSVHFISDANSAIELEVATLQNGSYALTITGVMDTAENKLILAVYPFEIDNLTGFPHYTVRPGVYPNPSSGRFFIDLHEGETISEVKLIDLSGRYIDLTGKLEKGKLELNTKAKMGYYILNFRNEFNDVFSLPILIY